MKKFTDAKTLRVFFEHAKKCRDFFWVNKQSEVGISWGIKHESRSDPPSLKYVSYRYPVPLPHTANVFKKALAMVLLFYGTVFHVKRGKQSPLGDLDEDFITKHSKARYSWKACSFSVILILYLLYTAHF